MKIPPRTRWLLVAAMLDTSRAQTQPSTPSIITFNATSFNGDDSQVQNASVYAAILEKGSLGIAPRYASPHVFSWTSSRVIELNSVTLHQIDGTLLVTAAVVYSGGAASSESGVGNTTSSGISPNGGVFFEPDERRARDASENGMNATITSPTGTSSSGTVSINWAAYIHTMGDRSVPWFEQALYLAIAWNNTGLTTSRRFAVSQDSIQDTSFTDLVKEQQYMDSTPVSAEKLPTIIVSSSISSTMTGVLDTASTNPSTLSSSPTPSPTTSSSATPSVNSGLSTGAIAGIAIGAALALLLIATILAVYFMRRRKQYRRDERAAPTAIGHHGAFGHDLGKETAIITTSTTTGTSPRSGSYDTGDEALPHNREHERERALETSRATPAAAAAAAAAGFELRPLRGPGRHNSKRAPMPGGSIAPGELPMALTTDEHVPLRSGGDGTSGGHEGVLPGVLARTDDGQYGRYTDHPEIRESGEGSPTHSTSHQQRSLGSGQHATHPVTAEAAAAPAAAAAGDADLPPPVIDHDAARRMQPSALSQHRAMTPYGHLVEEGMTDEEIRAMEEEERHLDAAIENAGHNR